MNIKASDIANVLREHLDATPSTPGELFQWARMCHSFAGLLTDGTEYKSVADFLEACGFEEAFGVTG